MVNMQSLTLLVFISTLTLAHGDLAQVSTQPTVEIVSGHPRIFSGENLKLRCGVQDDYNATWGVLWFRDSRLLPQSGHLLYLRRVSVKANGKYICQGVIHTAMGNLYTRKSQSVEVQVDGGWAILHSNRDPILVGETVELTCNLRDNPTVREVILYKNGAEVMRNGPLNRHFTLPNVTLADSGRYSCRASWDISRRTHSVISAPVYVEILEVLTKPVLVRATDDPHIPAAKMKLLCQAQYNAPDPAPSALYYFYQDDSQVAPASSHNSVLLQRTPGSYSCKIRVPQLGLLRSSDGQRF